MRTLTSRIAAELLTHEGLVPEAYRDSRGVWTWSVGITAAAGHRVYPRYRDNPQSLAQCLAVFLWALERRYLPAVLAAFGAHDPLEHELAAALSFHYNTGGIARAEWLRRHLVGDREGARRAILNWARPPEVLGRRRRERDVFFDQRWSGDGHCLVYEVAKPSYRPVRGKRVEIGPVLAGMMGEAESAPAECPVSERDTWFDRLFG